MDGFINIPESLSIAMHALILLASRYPSAITQPEVSSTFSFSLAHVAKVMQSLRRAGLVDSIRGPQGGFVLSKAPETIYLHEILASIKRPLFHNGCLLKKPACERKCCLLGATVAKLEKEFFAFLSSTTLATLSQSTGILLAKK